jgi:hypothetical protein
MSQLSSPYLLQGKLLKSFVSKFSVDLMFIWPMVLPAKPSRNRIIGNQSLRVILKLIEVLLIASEAALLKNKEFALGQNHENIIITFTSTFN